MNESDVFNIKPKQTNERHDKYARKFENRLHTNQIIFYEQTQMNIVQSLTIRTQKNTKRANTDPIFAFVYSFYSHLWVYNM